MSESKALSNEALNKRTFLLEIREDAWKARAIRQNTLDSCSRGAKTHLVIALAGLATQLMVGATGSAFHLFNLGQFVNFCWYANKFPVRRNMALDVFKRQIRSLGEEVKAAKQKAKLQSTGAKIDGDPWRRNPKATGPVGALAK